MSGPHEARIVQLVENAHPRRIARHAEEWERCARILEDAANRIESLAARQAEIGGQTGPSMARAVAQASDVLRVKARDLQRGSAALSQVAEATEAHREEKRRIDRDHPDDGTHVVLREEGSRVAADGQEEALKHGIHVMRSIEVGDDPRRTPITVQGPGPVTVVDPAWWPPREVRPDPPIEPLGPDDPDAVQTAVPQGPGAGSHGSGVPTGSVGTPAIGSPSGSSSHPGALAGAAVLGGAGAIAGGRSVLGGTTPASGARGIGAGGASAAGGVLGRNGSAAGAGGAGGRGGPGGRGGVAGAGASGGRGGRRTRDREQGKDRDLHDDGDGWLDDEAGPDVLR